MTFRAVWDIAGTGAKADACAIWIVQFVGREIRLLHYYEAVGQPMATHVNWLRKHGYGDALCILPLLALRAGVQAMIDTLDGFKRDGIAYELRQLEAFSDRPVENWYEFTGIGDIRRLEDRYMPADAVERWSDALLEAGALAVQAEDADADSPDETAPAGASKAPLRRATSAAPPAIRTAA